MFNFLWAGGLNVYDLYRDCDPNPEVNSLRMTALLNGVGHNITVAARRPRAAVVNSDAPCLNDSNVITYMNDAKVRSALNIPFNLGRWDICR